MTKDALLEASFATKVALLEQTAHSPSIGDDIRVQHTSHAVESFTLPAIPRGIVNSDPPSRVSLDAPPIPTPLPPPEIPSTNSAPLPTPIYTHETMPALFSTLDQIFGPLPRDSQSVASNTTRSSSSTESAILPFDSQGYSPLVDLWLEAASTEVAVMDTTLNEDSGNTIVPLDLWKELDKGHLLWHTEI